MNEQNLTLKQLRAVAEVYRARQLSAAARALNVSQPAVSALLKQIEGALGVQLFDRTTRSLTPTAAGEDVIGLVQRILVDVEQLDSSIRDLRDLSRGMLRITATPATGLALLPEATRRYRAAHPGIDLRIDDCAPDQFLPNIRQERAEFGIGMPPIDAPEFDVTPLCSDPLMALVPPDHRLAAGDHVTWAQLGTEDLILSRRDYGSRDLVERTMRDLGLTLRIAAEVSFTSTCTWLAATGVGIAVLPDLYARMAPDQSLRKLPIQGPEVRCQMSVVTKMGRGLSPAAKAFVALLNDLHGPSQTPALALTT